MKTFLILFPSFLSSESYTAKTLRELKREPSKLNPVLLVKLGTLRKSCYNSLSLYECIFSGVVTPPPAALVRPGTVHTYEWTVPVGAGPVQGEADCLTYLYYSGVDPVKDTSSGLVGPLLVCRLGSLKKGVQVRKRHQKRTNHVFTFH